MSKKKRVTEHAVIFPSTVDFYKLPDDYVIYSLNMYFQTESGEIYEIPYEKCAVETRGDEILVQIPDIKAPGLAACFRKVSFFKRKYFKFRYFKKQDREEIILIIYGRMLSS